MSLLLNILWLVFGGLPMAIGWVIAAAIMAITIIGLPWTPAAFRIAGYTLLPFGQTVQDAPSAGALSFVGNVVWFILAGWWLALGHLVLALPAGRHHHRYPVRLGAPEARWAQSRARGQSDLAGAVRG